MVLIQSFIEKLVQRQDLSFEESQQAIDWMMSDAASPVLASALLVLLQSKGPTVDEIAGAALAMRQKSQRIQAPSSVIDTCSTGGNGISTFNISTCAAFIASGAGAIVAKHGNRSNTRKSGSAEVLEALGVQINLTLAQTETCLKELGICFCYAIHHHPSMKWIAPVRKELGVPTLFNILGPLTNPAGAQRQLIGVPHEEWTLLLAQVLQRLDAEKAMVVWGEGGLCELSVFGKTTIAELKGGDIQLYEVTPESLGLARGSIDSIRIDTPMQSAKIIEKILNGSEKNTPRDIALLNAAGALVAAGLAKDLHEGLEQARHSVDSGKAFHQLQSLIQFTHSL